MRRTFIALAATTIFAAPALAQSVEAPAGAYVNDKTHSSLVWKVKHQGLSWYTARFTSFDAELNFDSADVTKSSLNVTIDPMTVETDYEVNRPEGNDADFSNELATDERFFNAGAHPEITFTSTSIEATGEDTGKVTGNLTFLGVTKPVTLDVTLNGHRNDPRRQKHKLGFSATGTIMRSEWGLDALIPAQGDEVRLEIETEFVEAG